MALALALLGTAPVASAQSAAREWNDILLESIRKDFARPTVHARNLYHMSVAMWDSWAAYDPTAQGVIHKEKIIVPFIPLNTLRAETISYASYRILKARFGTSPGFAVMSPQYDALMTTLGYDPAKTSTLGNTASALGNRIAVSVLAHGLQDNANEAQNYVNQYYQPVNPPLVPALPGNPTILNPNRWQPLALDFFVDQSGQVVLGGYPEFLSPEWGAVDPFSLTLNDVTVYNRDGFDYQVYHDPGAPPLVGTTGINSFKWNAEFDLVWSSHLDPTDGVMIDVSPGSIGNATLPNGPADYDLFYDFMNGGDSGAGYPLNPVTGLPYAPQIVPRGDYARILAEFWADGPASETPPGHWFTLLNYVSDHPLTVKQFAGQGPVLDDLEWDVKTYLTLGGAMHDCAVSAWGVKGWYDYARPVSSIRYLADLGQCSDSNLPHYNPDGIDLIPGFIELVTLATTAPGQKHNHLIGNEGKIAVKSWRGPGYIQNPAIDFAGVGWILAENWWPYQRPSFVTPPFAGYVSGHSTFSRAAAIIMDKMTGSPYFPGGLGEFHCQKNQFLVFEEGPSVDVVLQWASYYDASDQCSLSRIWGGIHPPADDIPGRKIGNKIGPEAFAKAVSYFDGTACDVPSTISLYGAGCAGEGGVTPKLSMAGCPKVGGTLTTKLSSAAPQGVSLLLFGIFETQIPGAGSCTLNVSPILLAVAAPTGGTFGVAGSGGYEIPLVVPTGSISGATIKMQAFVSDTQNPWGYTSTNGVSVTFD